ncbi:hypothetical protein HCEG_01374 [Histoplasma capsulatum var. duboisii H88]|uniref:Uncharacterized protein n=2 Tax=Ajellomyces capsulatus TaxID=5037 RepID=F0U4W9_AJEC8|nr:hypothetical protein HCDG_01518 [Histoplasma capsulatum H143]EGC42012.1 hypothetical protein HCEG_01374 [Histoplasma capsulatum var. duboisii H88]QSS51564.1 hypothetical protein I7I53_06922 [Histoplasma capsulatum var. duboisii H88]
MGCRGVSGLASRTAVSPAQYPQSAEYHDETRLDCSTACPGLNIPVTGALKYPAPMESP